MNQRHLQKWHGAGNDFFVDVLAPGESSPWNATSAAALCERHVGLGADGLLIVTSEAPYRMTLFNADGSLAEMSGNGIRCLVAALGRRVRLGETVDIVTDAGVRAVSLRMADDFSGEGSVEMGVVTLSAHNDPRVLAVAHVGNPHVVVSDDPSWTDSDREALADEWALGQGGANVEFVTVSAENEVTLRVIERGAGWTLACGTGSVASAATLSARGLVGSEVLVHNPGGTLRVRLGERATLAGPVAFVAEATWTLP